MCIKFLELASSAIITFRNANEEDKRKVLRFVFSNHILEDKKLFSEFKQPLTFLRDLNVENKKTGGKLSSEFASRLNQLPRLDSNQ